MCPGGSTCVLQERNRVGSGLLGLKNKQAGVPPSAAQAASPWSLCPQSALSPMLPGRPHVPAWPGRAPQQGRREPAGLNPWGQHKQVLEPGPGRPRPRAWSEQRPGLPWYCWAAQRGREGTASDPAGARSTHMRASDSENVAGRQRLPAPQLLVPTSQTPPSPGVSAQPVLVTQHSGNFTGKARPSLAGRHFRGH